MLRSRASYVFIDGGYLRGAILRDLLGRKDVSNDPTTFATFLSFFKGKYIDSIGDLIVRRMLYYDVIIGKEK